MPNTQILYHTVTVKPHPRRKSTQKREFIFIIKTFFVPLQTIIVHLMKEFLIAIGLLGVAFALLSIRIILKKNGSFSSQHISENKVMRRRGIHCATSQDREAKAAAGKKLNIKNL